LTAAGEGVLIFDVEDKELSSGRITKLDIPDPGILARFEQLAADGNPEALPKIGGAMVPDNPKEHLDVLLSIMLLILDEGHAGFDYVQPDLQTGIPGGDAWN